VTHCLHQPHSGAAVQFRRQLLLPLPRISTGILAGARCCPKRKALWCDTSDEVAPERVYWTPQRAKESQLDACPPPPPFYRDVSVSIGTRPSVLWTPSESYYKRQRMSTADTEAFTIEESLLVPDLPPLPAKPAGSPAVDCLPICLLPRMMAADHHHTCASWSKEYQIKIHPVKESLEHSPCHVASISIC
jgi:hypothetical protein